MYQITRDMKLYTLSKMLMMHEQRLLFSVDVDYSNHDDVIKWKHFPRYWQETTETLVIWHAIGSIMRSLAVMDDDLTEACY